MQGQNLGVFNFQNWSIRERGSKPTGYALNSSHPCAGRDESTDETEGSRPLGIEYKKEAETNSSKESP